MGNCSSQLLTSNQTFRPKRSGFNVRECFHMTSRRPYWCPKTIKRRPCWCSKPILWELQSFLVQTLSFVSINLHRCWPRYLAITLTPAQHKENFVVLFVAENAHDFVVNMDSLSQHPTKRCTQEVVCCYGNYSTSKLEEKEMKKIILINYQPL